VRRAHGIAVTLSLGAFIAIAASSGCGGGAGDFCELAQTCEHGNDMDLDACQISFDSDQEVADLHNCSSEYSDYFDCLATNSRCNNNVYEPDQTTCQEVSDRYHNCIKE